jgi:hypothetical protein
MGIATAFSFGASAIDDLFGAKASGTKAKGLRVQADAYRDAADFSLRNIDFTRASTEVQMVQTQRKLFTSIGQSQADVAGAGFFEEGSGGDIMRQEASKAALEMAVLNFQGKVQEEGFRVQSESYLAQAKAADMAAKAEDKAKKGSLLGGILKAGAAIGSMFLPF